MISVGDAINEPRYPSLKAIMGAKKKQLDTKATGDVEIDAGRVGSDGSKTTVLAINPPPAKQAGEIIEDEDTDETVQKIVVLARGKEAAGMSGILTYVLHYENELNKNSLGAVSEAAKLAGELGQRGPRGRRRRERLTDELCARSASTARRRSTARVRPRAWRSRSST